MSEAFIGEIRMFAGNFAPRDNAFCDGQLLPIAQHTALFSLVGITYGGNGQTTMGLPDLRDRAPMQAGGGPGLTPRPLGQKSGASTVTLSPAAMPNHSHQLRAAPGRAEVRIPSAGVTPARSRGTFAYGQPPPSVSMASEMVATAGGSQGHDNQQPYLTVNFIIALQGIYPSRS